MSTTDTCKDITVRTETIHGDERKKNVQLLGVIGDFCEETTAHGIGQVIKRTFIVVKILWLVAFFGAVIGNAYHISTLVNLYLGYPMQEVTITEHSSISFPDVTICNIDAISETNYAQMLQNTSSRLSLYLAKVRQMYNAGIIREEELDHFNTNIQIQNNIGVEETESIGHQIEDLVIRCTFRGKSCNIRKNFKLVVNPFLYNCYTFDPGVEGENFVATGASNGLSMILFLETNHRMKPYIKYDNIFNSAHGVGLKVLLHPRHSYPNPYTAGMDVMPGHSTSVAFEATRSKNLPPPHGNCIYNQSVQGIVDYGYSTSLCLTSCLQRQYMKFCGCKSVYQSVTVDKRDDVYCETLSTDEDLQKVFNIYKKEVSCTKKIWTEFSRTRIARSECGCKQRCNRYQYRNTITESLWPAAKYYNEFVDNELRSHKDNKKLEVLLQRWDAANGQNNASSNNYHFLGEMFSRINVYLPNDESVLRQQRATYPLSKLFSDIGGTLGLWVGFSLLTMIEILQLGVNICMVICRENR